jgi:hypothetical protein
VIRLHKSSYKIPLGSDSPSLPYDTDHKSVRTVMHRNEFTILEYNVNYIVFCGARGLIYRHASRTGNFILLGPSGLVFRVQV